MRAGRTPNPMTDEPTDPVTDADEGLPVVDSEGVQIGVVARVEGDEVYVDPDPDVGDDARQSLGWNPSDDAVQPLPRDSFERGGDEASGDVLRLDLDDRNRGA